MKISSLSGVHPITVIDVEILPPSCSSIPIWKGISSFLMLFLKHSKVLIPGKYYLISFDLYKLSISY
jgi:hypothetical protein